MDIQNILEQAKQRGLSAIDSIKKTVTPEPKSALQRTYETYQKIEPVLTRARGIAEAFKVPQEQLPGILRVPLTEKQLTTKEYAKRTFEPVAQTAQLVSSRLGRGFQEELRTGVPAPKVENVFAPFEILTQGVTKPVWNNIKLQVSDLRKSLGLPTIELKGGTGPLKEAAITGKPFEGRTEITWNEVLGKTQPVKPSSNKPEDVLSFNREANNYQINRFLDFLPEALTPGAEILIPLAGGIKQTKEINPQVVDDAIKNLKAAGEPLSKQAEDFIKNTFTSLDNIKTYLTDQVTGIKQVTPAERQVVQTAEDFTKTYVKEQQALRELERQTPRTFKQKIEKLWTDYKINFETQQEEIYKALKQVERTYGNLKPTDNPIYKLGLLYKTSRQVEEYMAKNGFTSIIDEANKIGSTAEFGQLLNDRRLLTIAKEQGRIAKDAEKKQAFVSAVLPKYQDLLTRYDNYMKGLLRTIFDNGLIDKEEYQRLKELKDYAPFQRVFNEADRNVTTETTKKSFGQVVDPKLVRELQDIENTIHENPIQSTIYYTYKALETINQNKFARSFGDLIKQGKLEGSQMLRISEDVIRRKALIEDVEQLKKVRDAVRNIIKKKKIQKGVLEKELNQLARRGINLSLSKTSTETIDPVLLDRLNQKIKVLIKDRNKLAKELNKLEIKDLELQENKAYFGFEDGLPKPQVQAILDKRVVNKEQFLLKTLFKTDSLVREKAIKYLNKNYGLFFNKMTDKQLLEFFRASSVDELETFVELAFDLNPRQYESFIKKLNASKSKEAQVLKEIDDAKNEAFTNRIVTALYKNEEELIKKYVGVSDQLKNVLSEIDRAKANIYYNDLFNSLIRKSPEELEVINKQLTKKEKNIKAIVETITNGQRKLDEVTGYIKQREEAIKNLEEIPAKGKATISWYKDGVREIAEVSKELAEAFKLSKDVGPAEDIVKLLEVPVRAWKTAAVGVNPESQLRQLIKDQTSLLFFTSPRAKASVLNPLNFMEALYGVTGASTSLQNFLRQAPLIGPRIERSMARARKEYKRFVQLGGGQTSFDVLRGENLKNFIEYGKKPITINLEKAEKFASKLEETSRFELYQIQKRYYLSKGFSNTDAELKAVYDSNNLLPNYFEKGKFTRVLEVASVFSNAKIKSGRALRRYIAEKPGEATFSLLTTVALPTAAVTYWNLSDEKRRAAYNDLPDWTKEIGLVILPENPTQDKDGNWEYYLVLQEETIAGLAQGFRRATELAMMENPDKVQQAMKGIVDTAHDVVLATTGQEVPFLASSPEKIAENVAQGQLSTLQPLPRSAIELATGFDFFRNKDIETIGDQGKYSYDRYSPKNSLLARDLSFYLHEKGIKNVSPKEIDLFLDANIPGLLNYVRYGLDDLRNKTGVPREFEAKNVIEGLTKAFKREGGGEMDRKLFEEQKQKDYERAKQNTGIKELIKQSTIGEDPQAALEQLKTLAPELTQTQFRQLENAVQRELAEETLTPTQKNLFSFTNEELEQIKTEQPERSADIETVQQLKETLSKQKNMSISGFKFKSVPGQSGGFVKPKKIKLGKIKKPKGLRKPRFAAPKKIRVKKTQRVKQPKAPKLPRVKPLKKVSRF